jgi:outer membrane protein TolC
MQVPQFYRWLLIPLLAIPAAAQQLSGGAAPLDVPQSLEQLLSAGSQSPFSGSVPSAKLTPGVLELSIDDAIDRGLKYNLGIVLSGQATAQAKAERLKDLSNILPQINGSLRESAIKVNLAAQGLSTNLLGVPVPPALHFSNSEARLSMSEDLLDLHAIENTRAATASVRAQDSPSTPPGRP